MGLGVLTSQEMLAGLGWAPWAPAYLGEVLVSSDLPSGACGASWGQPAHGAKS